MLPLVILKIIQVIRWLAERKVFTCHTGLDKLQTFEVKIDGENVIVRGNAEAIKSGRKKADLCTKSKDDARVFAVVGGGISFHISHPRNTNSTDLLGPAGLTCVETLRAEGILALALLIWIIYSTFLAGFTGSIVFFSTEKLLPYDRTKLSKAMTIEHDKIVLRDASYFEQHGVELRLGVEVQILFSLSLSLWYPYFVIG